MISKSIEKRSLQNIIAGILSFGVSMVQSILLIPLLLRFWGEEKYAIWIALWAFVSLMRLLDVGFLGLIGNEFTLAYHLNKEKSAELLGSAIRISFLTGFFEFFIFLIFWYLNLSQYITGISNSRINFGILICLLPWALTGSVISVVVRTIPALGYYSKMVYFSMLSKIVEISTLSLCILLNYSIYRACIIMSSTNLVYSILLNFFLKKLIPDFYPWWKKGSLSVGFTLFKRSLALTLNNLLEQFTNNGIILLISKTIGLNFLPLFTTTRTITNTSQQVTAIITDPLSPELIKYHVKNEQVKIIEVFRTNWMIMNLIINLCFSISLFFINHLYYIWTAGKIQFNDTLYYLLILTVAFSSFGRPMLTYIKGLNLIKELNILTISRFTLLFGIGIPLILKIGIVGLGVSILISEVVCSGILTFWFTKLRINLLTFMDYFIAISPVISLSFFFLFVSSNLISLNIIFFIFMVLQLLLTYLQWNSIDPKVRIRLINSLPILNKYA